MLTDSYNLSIKGQIVLHIVDIIDRQLVILL